MTEYSKWDDAESLKGSFFRFFFPSFRERLSFGLKWLVAFICNVSVPPFCLNLICDVQSEISNGYSFSLLVNWDFLCWFGETGMAFLLVLGITFVIPRPVFFFFLIAC